MASSTALLPAAREGSSPETPSHHSLKGLASLPPEIHHMVAEHLPYPDLLSLKLTNTYFAALVGSKLTVKMRISWVKSRYAQHLPVPKSTKLSFKSDALFVANPEVKTILRRRRHHLECADHERGGAFVFSMFADVDHQGRGDTQQPWSKVCLVTGNPVCPKIQELEVKRQQYKNSVMGKVAVPVVRAIGWLRGVWRHLSDPWPWIMAGRLRASGFHRAYLITLLGAVVVLVLIWTICCWSDIWASLCIFAQPYWRATMGELGVSDG
ncbi:uncharacterized protein Z519_05039 [Cladophialophora bantiana CBS 173.52]|uniref:F-box domain-containing protein n=1 Tax=Cladophialophora bantiana (strain ATCC 10958 / CBS 173.52 / CDC B-1940 / NIH 8579) TaxID=1442370 RepID=A0A0D2HS74_CLAB1|nr:uncharacterized protein Z519_05039 [Cladophialophora bantiana CBS 173.52]KIW93725.1 hypothetical protein Z519_05039 [Cladophialophora bantiana CBS 173.52]